MGSVYDEGELRLGAAVCRASNQGSFVFDPADLESDPLFVSCVIESIKKAPVMTRPYTSSCSKHEYNGNLLQSKSYWRY